MKTISYIDLGLHTHAREITMMQEACHGLPVKLLVNGIEANPNYITDLRQRFAHNPDVTIHCYAISDKEQTVELYLSPQSHGHGNSIFADKYNVTSESVTTLGVKLSTLLDFKTLPLADINILKFNIEGAEHMLIKDLVENHMHPLFHIYCGAPSDMHKIPSLAKLQRTHTAAMAAYGIHRHDFYHSAQPTLVQHHIANMRKIIKELL